MRLQNLEIKGFKSFAEKTVVNFDRDVIGIVGPNGCGKSNIVDAIRWVLGEQKSKELRSDKMSSVIFNGTSKRKQSGVAEVSLTFSNDKGILPLEYSEIKITRILYRSGESEYKLNGVSCRLKDITNLFIDTGIGSNSYAIIALGMVDDILSDRENSRRMLFEQAAGISKYKQRKKDTLSKLKSTQEDLDRVEDLLFEIEDNLKKLEKQAKRAKIYLEIKAEYKTLAVELSKHQLFKHKTEYKKVEKELTDIKDAHIAIDTKSHELEATIEKEKKANLDKERNLNERQKALSGIINALRDLETEKKVLQEKVHFLTTNKDKIAREIEDARLFIAEIGVQIDAQQVNLTHEKEKKEALALRLTNAVQSLELAKEKFAATKSALDAIMLQLQAVEKQTFEKEKESAIHLSKIEGLSIEMDNMSNEIRKRKQAIHELDEKVQSAKSDRSTLEKLLTDFTFKEDNRIQEINRVQATIDKLNEERAKVSRQLDAKENEYKLTKSLVENLEGFPESIKFLSKNKDWKNNAPLLSDIIYTPDDYRIAIENYLDTYLNYYVVDTQAEAFQAINLLDKAQKGKANFFVLEAFKNYTTSGVMLPGQYTIATDIITVDDKYRALANYLLGNVAISDGENPEDIQVPDGSLVIAKSGRFAKGKYVLSGGSVGLFEGKRIGRKKNLEILEKDIKKLQEQLGGLDKQLANYQEESQLQKSINYKADIDQTRKKLADASHVLTTAMTQYDNYSTYVQEAEEKEIQMRQRIVESQQLLGDLEEQIKSLQVQKSEIAQKNQHTDSSYQAIADELNQASASFNELNIQTIQQDNHLNTLEKDLSYKTLQLQEKQRFLENSASVSQTSQLELSSIQDKIQSAEEQIIEFFSQRNLFNDALAAAETAYFESKNSIVQQEEELRKVNRTLNESNARINTLKDTFTEIKFQISSIAERIKIEFDLQVNDIVNEEPDPNYQLEKLESEVPKLKTKLHNYGEVNPMAVEAYDEMKERFDFISEQKMDLIQSKDTLMETIQEIESTATTHFMDSFEQVRANFQKVFRSLFQDGDTCDITLEDPTDPLESKIKISAKPKGKRPQSIDQLSGGEKTLTATALLFALYLLKPAPFCIFDEVDAPLDDANISKFNRIIKDFSKESQFIIVTHNKQTMAAVDSIYGVTMGEPGVSSVVPVDFSEWVNG